MHHFLRILLSCITIVNSDTHSWSSCTLAQIQLTACPLRFPCAFDHYMSMFLRRSMCTSTVFFRCDCPRILDVPHLCLLVVNHRSCPWRPRMAYDNSALVWINLATSNSSLTWDKLFPCGLVFFIWFNSVQLYAVLFVPKNFIIPPVFCTEERPSSFFTASEHLLRCHQQLFRNIRLLLA